MDLSVDDCNAHVIALPDEWLRAGGSAHAGKDRVFVCRGVINFVPLDRPHVAPAKQMNLAVEDDRRHGATWPAESGNRRPLIGGCVISKAFGMRAAILLDEAAKGVDFRANRNPGDMVAREREGCLQRPDAAFRIEHLMKILVDAVLGVAGNRMNFALALDDRMLAGRDRHARLFDPFAGIGGLGRDAGHVALLLDGFGNVGDRLVVQAEKERKVLFCHELPELTYVGTASRNSSRVSSTPSRAPSYGERAHCSAFGAS